MLPTHGARGARTHVSLPMYAFVRVQMTIASHPDNIMRRHLIAYVIMSRDQVSMLIMINAKQLQRLSVITDRDQVSMSIVIRSNLKRN